MVHQDVIYAKGSPIEVVNLTLEYQDGSSEGDNRGGQLYGILIGLLLQASGLKSGDFCPTALTHHTLISYLPDGSYHLG